MTVAELVRSLTALLANAIMAVVTAGEDQARRDEALMTTAEELKALADRVKFGRG